MRHAKRLRDCPLFHSLIRLSPIRMRSSVRTLANGWLNVALPAQGFVLLAIMSKSGGPLWTPTQSNQYLPYVAGMVADAKLAFDQIGHTQTCPERGFIAQRFGAFQKQHMEPFTVLLVHLRLASSSTRFL